MHYTSIFQHSPLDYQLIVRGSLMRGQRTWFANATITPHANGTTTLLVHVADQSALHGMLNRIRDLGLVLVQVQLLQSDGK